TAPSLANWRQELTPGINPCRQLGWGVGATVGRFGRMGHASAPEFLVLHALRLKGFAGTGAVAETAGVSEEDATQRLDAAKADGLVVYREGRISGWSLTATGRARHGELLEAERNAAAYRARVDAGYKRFLELNG